MINYNFLIFLNISFLFVARFISAVVFFKNEYFALSLMCTVSSLISLFFIYLSYRFKLVCEIIYRKKIFSRFYKFFLYKKFILFAKIIKKIAKIEYLDLGIFIWYFYQIEVLIYVFSSIYFGWGWGFEIYLFVFASYFYLNLKTYHRAIFLYPLFYFAIYVFVYFLSEKIYYKEGQLIIYLANASAALLSIFVTQVIIRLGNIIQFISFKNREARIEKLANFDPLTNIYNKYSFLEIMSNKHEYYLERKINSQASVLIFDIFNLKEINEEFSTELGNEILKEFIYVLKKYSESYEKYLARWSGSEIVMLIVNETETVVQNYIKEVKREANKNSFGIKDAKLKVIIADVFINDFNYQINKHIKEAYIKLITLRENTF